MSLKQSAMAILVLMSAFAVIAGADPGSGQEQAGKQDVSMTPKDEDQIIGLAEELRKDNRVGEALSVLNEGMDRFPASAKLLTAAYQIYLAEKRYEECVQLLNDKAGNFPESLHERIRGAKLMALQPLVQSLLEEGKTEKAFSRFREMADAGYRGFHQFMHNPQFEPLRRHAEFKDVMKKIAENTGLDRPATDFMVALAGGGTYSLSARKGRVVLVDFWSTECPPCIEELPNLRALYLKYKDSGFEIISISLDGDRGKLDAFLAANPMPWNTVFSGKGWRDDAAKLYEISWIPSLWLVDKKGFLRYFDVRGEDLKAAIEGLLAEQPND
jgi:thiol-disulfide isomerase/thioredoxin